MGCAKTGAFVLSLQAYSFAVEKKLAPFSLLVRCRISLDTAVMNRVI